MIWNALWIVLFQVLILVFNFNVFYCMKLLYRHGLVTTDPIVMVSLIRECGTPTPHHAIKTYQG